MRSSPRAWGCFPGIIPPRHLTYGLPHVRGGVSYALQRGVDLGRSSPRAWGCFRHLQGIHRRWSGLPHVRGGVSEQKDFQEDERVSSPRAWGCFCTSRRHAPYPYVFPTCVGVFPASAYSDPRKVRLPHVRGGVSLYVGGVDSDAVVFPTCVGVFLSSTLSSVDGSGLPHVRGGVST